MIASTVDRVRLSDGAETSLERWGESGPVLLCVHGLGSSRRGWLRVAEHFAATHRVLAYDQRGHGDAALGPLRFETTVEDLGAVIAAAGAPVHALIGHSWGGAVALAGGRRFAVDRVAAIDPMLHVSAGTWATSVIPQHAPLLLLDPAERARAVREQYAGYHAADLDGKLHAVRRLSMDAIVALGDENGIDAGGWDHRSALDDYPRPVWLALADPKRSVVAAADRAGLASRGGVRLRTSVFDGASHSLQRDAFDRFVPALAAFLNE